MREAVSPTTVGARSQEGDNISPTLHMRKPSLSIGEGLAQGHLGRERQSWAGGKGVRADGP